jgi:hypothetical protein
MTSIPAMTCPTCRRNLEYHVTIEMLNPPVGRIDTGYCSACARLIERVRDTDTFYETTAWPPLCRECRQPVTFAGVRPGAPEGTALFQCPLHQREQWTWSRSEERWIRVGDLRS